MPLPSVSVHGRNTSAAAHLAMEAYNETSTDAPTEVLPTSPGETLPGATEWGPLVGISVPILVFVLVLYLSHRRNALAMTFGQLTRPTILLTYRWFMPLVVLTFVVDGLCSYMVYAYGFGTQTGTAALVMYGFFVFSRILWVHFWFGALNFWRAFYAMTVGIVFGFIALVLFFIVDSTAGILFLITYFSELYIAFATYLVALNNATNFLAGVRLGQTEPGPHTGGDAI